MPINYKQLIYEEMLHWNRESKATVDQYTERFHELTVRSRAIETESQTLARYLSGLKTELQKEMLTARVYSVEEAYQLALQLERQASRTTQRSQFTDVGVLRSSTTSVQKQATDPSKEGTVGDNKGKAKVFGGRPQCYKCRGFGHYAVVCPTRDQRIAYVCEKGLLSEKEIAAEVENQRAESDITTPPEGHLRATDLPLCVVTRVLTGQNTQPEETT